MADSSKRLLTDDVYDAHARADQMHTSYDTSDDLVLRLRNAASRVRKSVTEGYRTTPSAFSKAQSTGSVFRSMNDTLRDVYANSTPGGLSNNNVTRKRARSVSEGESGTITEECELLADATPSESTLPSVSHEPVQNRQIKALRASRRPFMETRSLPVGALSFAGTTNLQPSAAVPTAVAEDDWSQEDCFQISQPAFEPMVFD